MDETVEGEWQWFRRSIRDSLLRPRRFAASLAREHYGLAGVLVVILAGIALSVAVDSLVITSKGLSVPDFASRILVDALLLGVRLAIVAALASGAVALFMRLVRHRDVSLDQAFTAITFALTPLLLVPVLAAALALVPESLPIVGILMVALVVRLLYGLFENVRPLAPLALAIAAVGIVIGSVPLTLPDQVSRIEFTALAYQPTLAPPITASPPVDGIAVSGDGFSLVLPSRWKEAHLGIAGELARYETDTDVLVVMRAAGSALLTPDSYAENVALAWRRGLDRTSSSRAIVRNGTMVILDDTYRGAVDGRREVLRQFTTVVGTLGIALLFRYIEPDEAKAISESTSIAASWRMRNP
ncbi:MAG TPA: Yip1 family protein [Candidatus Limnocylindria bacterium]|nr:Yip1 family protein [Candidatus Limnocylindria bacterium]